MKSGGGGGGGNAKLMGGLGGGGGANGTGGAGGGGGGLVGTEAFLFVLQLWSAARQWQHKFVCKQKIIII